MADRRAPVLVVDAANVVGSVPDGWWRDRAGATTRLRDALALLAGSPLGDRVGGDAPDWVRDLPLDLVLVVEGAAAGVSSVPGVEVVAADGSGDDMIVSTVAAITTSGRRCAVVTADRELRERVRALGAVTLGPRAVYP